MKFWNKWRVSKLWQNFYFWVNCPFKNGAPKKSKKIKTETMELGKNKTYGLTSMMFYHDTQKPMAV